MTAYTFVSDDSEDGGQVAMVAQDGLEFLGDVAELMLQFLRAAGYTYVKQLVVVKDDGSEVATLV